MDSLARCYTCLSASRPSVFEPPTHSRRFATLYVSLEQLGYPCCAPKLYLIQELCEMDAGARRLTWCYRDEHLGGSVALKVLHKSCARHAVLSSVPTRNNLEDASAHRRGRAIDRDSDKRAASRRQPSSLCHQPDIHHDISHFSCDAHASRVTNFLSAAHIPPSRTTTSKT